ncbi:hypothetical protein [Absidia glauca]|uniref:Uncharacterized protein n=1 Tax=Absidia glauca TaxID=4829 RepID=A0A168TBY7_ABSGL|nr:hypothetical protein [Absidia glauca]
MDVACAKFFLADCTDPMSFETFNFSANEKISSEDFGDAYPVGSIEYSADVFRPHIVFFIQIHFILKFSVSLILLATSLFALLGATNAQGYKAVFCRGGEDGKEVDYVNAGQPGLCSLYTDNDCSGITAAQFYQKIKKLTFEFLGTVCPPALYNVLEHIKLLSVIK